MLVVSKVANFSIDLPEASVAVQVSGTFGSRQEEAQRLGRLLRPKGDGRQAHFYSVVSRDTLDTDYAAHRQRFLAEQGYAYRIVDADDLLGPALPGRGLTLARLEYAERPITRRSQSECDHRSAHGACDRGRAVLGDPVCNQVECTPRVRGVQPFPALGH